MVKKSSKNDISKKVMNDINNQEIKMRPKLYFTLLSWALVASTAMFIVLSALTCLIAYRQITYGRGLRLDEFGSRGNTDFITALPWLAIVAGMLTFVAAYILIKHFDVSYRHKLYVTISALIVAVVGLGVIFANTGVEDKAKGFAPFRGLNSFETFTEDHSLEGEIVEIQDDSIVIETEEGEVTVYPEDDMRGRAHEYEVEDTITVYGDKQGDEFKAYGARPGEKANEPQTKGIQNRFLK